MAKTSTKLGFARKPATTDPPSPDLIAQALKELGIDKPFYTCRVVGGRLEFRLYGGAVVCWPPDATRPDRFERKPVRSPGGK